MGCTASSQRASIRKSRKVSLAFAKNNDMDMSNKSGSTNPTTNRNAAKSEASDCRPRRSSIQANDRVSLAAALEEYDHEGSNHTASTGTSESAVICIMRSDKLAFSGAGIRRHSRRKRRRQNGKDNTRIIVLRKPSRRDTTMMKVDERIPNKELKKLRKKAIADAEKKKTPKAILKVELEETLPLKEAPLTPQRKSKYSSKKMITTPLKAVRKLHRKNSTDLNGLMMVDECSKEQILSMSISSKDFLFQ